jgi:hypothetical protein
VWSDTASIVAFAILLAAAQRPTRCWRATPQTSWCTATHRALLFRAPDGRVVVDPGSAAPPRFNLKPSVAILTVTDGGPIDVRFIEFV